jgi:hypothetical protein
MTQALVSATSAWRTREIAPRMTREAICEAAR